MIDFTDNDEAPRVAEARHCKRGEQRPPDWGAALRECSLRLRNRERAQLAQRLSEHRGRLSDAVCSGVRLRLARASLPLVDAAELVQLLADLAILTDLLL